MLMDDRVRVYRAPTCSNCMRVVGYLTKRGVEFDDIDVTRDKEALKVLGSLGAKAIPAVTKNGRFVLGYDLEQIDDLVGLTRHGVRLGNDELIDRLISLTEAWIRFSNQIPPAHYNDVTPGLEGVKAFVQPDGHVFVRADGQPFTPHGTYFGLVGHILHHVSRVRLSIKEPTSLVFSTESLYAEYGEPLPDVPMKEVIAVGQSELDYIRDWRSGASKLYLDNVLNTFLGPQTLHQMLSREAYSLAQHTRQLMTILRDLGIGPDGPIGEAEYAGLHVPQNIWK